MAAHLPQLQMGCVEVLRALVRGPLSPCLSPWPPSQLVWPLGSKLAVFQVFVICESPLFLKF